MIHLIDYLAIGVRDNDGNRVPNGQVLFYKAGTSTRARVFADSELTQPLSNPATLDAAGRLIAFSSERMKLVLQKSTQEFIRMLDYVGYGAGDIQASDLADSSFTQSKFAPGVVTNTKLAAGSILTSLLADGVVTSDKIASQSIALGKLPTPTIVTSSSSGNFTTTSTADITNLTVTVTTDGRPVQLMMVPDGSTNEAVVTGPGTTQSLSLLRDGSMIGKIGSFTSWMEPFIDLAPSAASHTYKLNITMISGTCTVQWVKLIARLI